MSKIEVTGTRVLVKPTPIKDVTDEGIHIPDASKKRPTTGTILSLGPAITVTDRVGVPQAGDRVIYSLYAGVDYELDGEKYVILQESEIIAILRD